MEPVLIDSIPLDDLAFRFLLVTTSTLFVAALVTSGYAIALRIAWDRRNRTRSRLGELWTEPLLAALADPDSPADFRPLVAADDELSFVQFVLEYCGRVRGDELRVLRRLAEPYLDEIARRARHRRPEVRLRSVQTLGALGLPRHRDTVVAALEDPSSTVAIVAARSLARAEFSDDVGRVLAILPRFEGWAYRFLGAMLADFGPEASPRLRDGLAAAAPDWLRTVYASALQLQTDPQAADVAARMLDVSGSVDLTSSLLRLLHDVGRPEHLPAVLPLVEAPDAAVRAQAVRTLGVLGDEEVVPMLVRALHDGSTWVSSHAARGLLLIGGPALLRRISAEHPRRAALLGQVREEVDS